MFANESAEYPEPDEDEASNDVLLHKPQSVKAPCLMHFLLKRWCYYVLCQAKLFI